VLPVAVSFQWVVCQRKYGKRQAAFINWIILVAQAKFNFASSLGFARTFLPDLRALNWHDKGSSFHTFNELRGSRWLIQATWCTIPHFKSNPPLRTFSIRFFVFWSGVRATLPEKCGECLVSQLMRQLISFSGRGRAAEAAGVGGLVGQSTPGQVVQLPPLKSHYQPPTIPLYYWNPKDRQTRIKSGQGKPASCKPLWPPQHPKKNRNIYIFRENKGEKHLFDFSGCRTSCVGPHKRTSSAINVNVEIFMMQPPSDTFFYFSLFILERWRDTLWGWPDICVHGKEIGEIN